MGFAIKGISILNVENVSELHQIFTVHGASIRQGINPEDKLDKNRKFITFEKFKGRMLI